MSYGNSFFPARFLGPRASRLGRKFSVCNLQNGQRKRLVRGVYFTLQVIEVHFSDNFLLVEVISAKLDGNGTITTKVDINMLQSHHRRNRRSTTNIDLASFQPDKINHKVKHVSISKLCYNCITIGA